MTFLVLDVEDVLLLTTFLDLPHQLDPQSRRTKFLVLDVILLTTLFLDLLLVLVARTRC